MTGVWGISTVILLTQGTVLWKPQWLCPFFFMGLGSCAGLGPRDWWGLPCWRLEWTFRDPVCGFSAPSHNITEDSLCNTVLVIQRNPWCSVLGVAPRILRWPVRPVDLTIKFRQVVPSQVLDFNFGSTLGPRHGWVLVAPITKLTIVYIHISIWLH
jgi:hypothetical protein